MFPRAVSVHAFVEEEAESSLVVVDVHGTIAGSPKVSLKICARAGSTLAASTETKWQSTMATVEKHAAMKTRTWTAMSMRMPLGLKHLQAHLSVSKLIKEEGRIVLGS